MLQELVLCSHGEELKNELVRICQEVVVLVDLPSLSSCLNIILMTHGIVHYIILIAYNIRHNIIFIAHIIMHDVIIITQNIMHTSFS